MYNHPPEGGVIHNEMATIKEFKEWLNRFPEDTIIEVGIQGRAGNYEAYGAVNFETLKLEDNDYGYGWEFLDFRTNQFIKEDSTYFGKCYLRLGETS
jgi:hypothetical protein